MKKLNKAYIVAMTLPLGVLAMCADSCRQAPPAATQAVAKTPHSYKQTGSISEITIVPEQVEFPEHEGRKEFVAYCNICHSLKYIKNQPNFSQKTWGEVVDKMIIKYNAPIDSANRSKILAYIMHIKGNTEK